MPWAKQRRSLFSSVSDEWQTPSTLYAHLDTEFHFTDDPAPVGGLDGLTRHWGERTFVNPPYSQISAWVKKSYDESQRGCLVVMLIPSRTDTQWWHQYVMQAQEIRFIKGRLRFSGAKWNAPFPSAVIVFAPRSVSLGEERG